MLVIESLIAGFAGSLDVLSTIRDVLPGANGGSLAASYAPIGLAETPGVSAVTGPVYAVAVLAIWGLAAIAISASFLRRRDVT